jgi:site-specific DNA recombinase
LDGKLSGKWSLSAIRRIFANSIYKGEMTWGKKTRRDGIITLPVPPIVDAVTWERAQHIKRDNRANARRGNDDCFWLLQGMVFCGVCRRERGGLLWGCRVSQRNHRYYFCRSGIYKRTLNMDKSCGLPYLPKERVEAAVWEKLTEFVSQPTLPVWGDVQRAWEQKQREGKDGAAQRLRALQRELAEKDAERERLIGMGQRGLLTLDELDERLAQWQRERDALAMELDRLTDGTAAQQQQAWERLSVTLRDIMREATPEERRELLQCWGVCVEVYPDRLRIVGKIPLTRGSGWFREPILNAI